MRRPPFAIEALADLVESVLRRLGGPLEGIDAAILGFVDLVAAGASALPAVVWIAGIGLATWCGRRLLPALAAVTGLYLILLSGLWVSTIETVAFGVVSGALSTAMVLLATTLTRHRRPPRIAPRTAQPLIVTLAVVTLIAVAPLFGTRGNPAWGLAGLLLAVALVRVELLPRTDATGLSRFFRPDHARSALMAGLASAVSIGLVSGLGLGGLAARAAATGDVTLVIQLSLALGGLAIVLAVALTATRPSPSALDRRPASGSTEAEQVEVTP